MHKNATRYLLVLLLILLPISSCANHDRETIEWAMPLMARIDGVDYILETTLDEDYTVDDSQITGYITSVVPITQGPTKDDEANFPAAQDAPYVRYSDDEYPDAILIPFGGYWNLFTPFEEGQESG